MDIKIVDSWLREYLETEANYHEIAEVLTLHGPTVESIEKRSDDVIYTIEVTSNRTDLLSVIGIARETAALLSQKGRKAELHNLPEGYQSLEFETSETLPLNIEMRNKTLVEASLAVVVSDLQLGPSPSFIKERLEKSGLRSLNNIIDISNYVMLETGQPLHIFDYDRVEGNKMKVRESIKGDKLTTLDGIERILPEGSIVIEDQKKLIDLCGIMGCENSSISDNTTRGIVWIERYEPSVISKTFRELNLATEAALRYEKYLDPTLLPVTLNRTLTLLKKHAGAKVASQVFESGRF